mmetsp:Transcript_16741/g.44919  ORF Transcript_16741/g.44919 Transcript_16741/m.44919 type:complete len:193 (-) Transcript_16741:227-805(-)
MLDGCEFSWAQVGIILKAAVAMANGFIGRDLFPESESFLLSALSTCKGNWLCAKAWKDLTSTEPPPEPTVIPDYTKVVNSPARQQWELFHKAHVRRWLVDAKPKRRPADAPPLQQVQRVQEPESADSVATTMAKAEKERAETMAYAQNEAARTLAGAQNSAAAVLGRSIESGAQQSGAALEKLADASLAGAR